MTRVVALAKESFGLPGFISISDIVVDKGLYRCVSAGFPGYSHSLTRKKVSG
jgi:hypothetical protein